MLLQSSRSKLPIYLLLLLSSAEKTILQTKPVSSLRDNHNTITNKNKFSQLAVLAKILHHHLANCPLTAGSGRRPPAHLSPLSGGAPRPVHQPLAQLRFLTGHWPQCRSALTGHWHPRIWAPSTTSSLSSLRKSSTTCDRTLPAPVKVTSLSTKSNSSLHSNRQIKTGGLLMLKLAMQQCRNLYWLKWLNWPVCQI